jgi:prepilin-type N-terminal cleavage/methylation domain-containing protein
MKTAKKLISQEREERARKIMRSANKGFTLVELIVVIAIIAILASVSIVGYNQFIQNARDSRAATELDVIIRQVEAYEYSPGADLTLTSEEFQFADLIIADFEVDEDSVNGEYAYQTADPIGWYLGNGTSDWEDLTALDATGITTLEGVVLTEFLAALNDALDLEVADYYTDDDFSVEVDGLELTVTYLVDGGTADWVLTITEVPEV